MSIFTKIAKVAKGALGVLAPTLASALPGPVGSIAKRAIEVALGLDPESDEAAIEAAIAAADPAQLVALRQADQDFKVKMEQLGVDLERVNAEDRASARGRQIALRDKTPPVLAWTIIVAWLAFTAVLFRWTPPDANLRLLDILFGILTSAVVGIINFYYGSSAGSVRKTEIMNGGGK